MTTNRVSNRLLRRSSLASLAGSIGSSTLLFGATALLASQLDEEAFDRYALATTILVAASAVGTLGYPTLLNRESAGTRLSGRVWRDAHKIAALTTAILVAALVAGYSRRLGGPLVGPLTLVGALAMTATTLDVAVARGALSLGATVVGAIARAMIFTLLTIGLVVVITPSATLAIGALAAATLFGAGITTSILVTRWTPSPDSTGLSIGAARVTSLKMAPISTSIVLLRRVDVFLITALISQSGAVGTFFLASRIAEILSYVPAAVNAFGSTDIAASAADRADLDTSLRRQAMLTTAAVVPAAIVLGGGGLVLFRVLGITTSHADLTLVLLLTTQLLSALIGPVGFIHTMTGHEVIASWASGGALLATMIVGIPLISAMGIVGAALGAVLTTLGWNLGLWISAYRIFGVRSGTVGLLWRLPQAESAPDRGRSKQGDHYP